MISRLLRRPEMAIFAMTFVAYSYFYQAGGWNQNSRFDLVRSMVEKQSLIIDDYVCATPHRPGTKQHRNTGDESKRGDHFYCDKAPGVSLLAVPAYALFHVMGPSEKSEAHLNTAAYLGTVVSIALPSALGVVALFVLLGALGASYRIRVLLSMGYAFATLAFPYATLLYGHQQAAALLVCAFALLAREKHVPDSKSPMFVVGLLLGYSVVSEYPAALVVVPITVYAATVVRPWKRLAWLIAGGATCAALLAAYHWGAFGGPLTLPYEFSTQKYRGLGFFMGLGVPNWPAFSNTMFTSYRGLFYSAPWLLAGLPGMWLLMRGRQFRAEGAVCVASFALFVWMTSSLLESWHGGWALGARYMVPAIPFLVIPIAAIFDGQPGSKRTTVLLVLLALAIAGSTLLMLAGTAVRPEVPQHIRRPFTDYLLPHFFRGELSLNPQSIDRSESPNGGPLYAWNLGRLFGLRGLLSLVPLALAMTLGGLWLRRVADSRP